MIFRFQNLEFVIENERIYLQALGDFRSVCKDNFVEITVSGRNKDSEDGIKMVHSSEASLLKYVSHEICDNTLVIEQKNDILCVETFFECFNDTNAVRVHTTLTNISNERITLEEVSSFVVGGIVDGGYTNIDDMYFTEFIQSHHAECQPSKHSFSEYGFLNEARQGSIKRRISYANVGAWSTKERLPQAIIENAKSKKMLMFQIESSNSWYYEISERSGDMYLYTGGANITFGSWLKNLMPYETYSTVSTAITTGSSLDEIVGEMTKYRRHICGLSECDRHLPSIFNEYMHLSWDSPSEESTKKYAPVVAKTGAEYYVIDCGWHNEEPGNIIYHYVGQWKESKTKFPLGLKNTLDYIKSLGMKPGLWIEPEIIGTNCHEMLDYYDDDCFFTRAGQKVRVFNRMFLDYRNKKVIDYMSETIRRMVEDYGAEYIKFDFNQDCGIGTELDADSYGEGLEECAAAFLGWVNEMKKRFPYVIFEGCASGGMRMDYKSLSTFSLISTSDQIQYDKYPYIAANILSAVIPEQAAVWSYPVGECKKEEISDRQIIMNMINSFLGRMHLASHLDYMTEAQLSLVREGVEYYNSLTQIKHSALPCFPLGLTGFGEKKVAAGLRNDNTVYLAVWNLDNRAQSVTIPMESNIISARIAYPRESDSIIRHEKNQLTVDFSQGVTASFIEIKVM